MYEPKWHPNSSRKIITRIVAETDLVLLSPAHFGNGDSENAADMPLLKDETDGISPLIPGSSICGALRSYLTAIEIGHRTSAHSKNSLIELLFGSDKGSKGKYQSRVIVGDSIGKYRSHEQRQGARLNPATRTAEEQSLYTYRLWSSNTVFPLHFELIISDGDNKDLLVSGFVNALAGLSNGNISLGAKKARGFGRIGTKGWRVTEYDLSKASDLLAWVNRQEPAGKAVDLVNITEYSKNQTGLRDHRNELQISATFVLNSSILIRSRYGLSASDPDVVHIKRPLADNTGKVAVIPGTSWAGALRTRAARIVELMTDGDYAAETVNDLFGSSPDQRTKRTASRITIDESTIEKCREDLVQSRVAIDPFTGGARDGALFDENPVFALPESYVPFRLKIVNPKQTDIGLSLLLLKDLWTGDISVGGEASVGRGRFKGKTAEIIWKRPSGTEKWLITEKNGVLEISGNKQELESFVVSLKSRNAEVKQ